MNYAVCLMMIPAIVIWGTLFDEYDVPPPGTKLDDECYETKNWIYCPPAQSDIRAYRKSPSTTSGNLYSSSLGELTIWGYGWGASGKDCFGDNFLW